MLLVPLVGCNLQLLTVLLVLSAVLAGFAGGSDLPLASEMSQRFPSTLYAVCNLSAMAAGSLVPMYTGILLSDFEDQWMGWKVLFLTSSGISLSAFLFFVTYAQAQRQPFDFVADESAGAAAGEESGSRGDTRA